MQHTSCTMTCLSRHSVTIAHEHTVMALLKTCSLNIDLGLVSLRSVEVVAMWLIDFSCSFKAHP